LPWIKKGPLLVMRHLGGTCRYKHGEKFQNVTKYHSC
jgi:hypothetical protein